MTTSADEILCPVDFSDTSERAIAYAARVARALGGRVRLAHVVPIPVPAVPVPEIGFSQELVTMPSEQLLRDARASLARLAQQHDLVDPALEVVTGSAPREILRIARESGASMIVMGSHGRTGLAHLLLGSVAERVMRGAHVPVTVVPAPAKLS